MPGGLGKGGGTALEASGVGAGISGETEGVLGTCSGVGKTTISGGTDEIVGVGRGETVGVSVGRGETFGVIRGKEKSAGVSDTGGEGLWAFSGDLEDLQPNKPSPITVRITNH